MSALVWLTIPVGALALALLWVAWATRTRPRADTHETLAAHRRFQAAFETHRDGVPDAAPGGVPDPRRAADDPQLERHRDSA